MRSVVGASMDDDDDLPPPTKRKRTPSKGKPRVIRQKRGRRDAGYMSRWLESARGAARWTLVWGLAIGMFFMVTVFAGLLSGGHVSAALAGLQGAGEGAMAGAGFTVQAVTLEGRSETAQREIGQMLGIKRGDLMFYVDVDEARARIEALPWVKSAEVRRVWPDRIVVRIVERTPVAVWQKDGAKTVIDIDGHPISGEDPARFASLPLVVGRGAESAVASLLKLVATQPNLKSRVKIAVRVGERRWDLQLDNAVEVRLPEEGAEAALAELVRLDREQNVLSRDIKAIDLRYPDRFIVKLPPGSPLITPARSVGGRET
ncbi:MAG: cell division protein FtsQ/DivIB [Alphaproteobacteria bacterium]|nr:cell division protein FtsQ/DivIB [Alphaproteobacteria bacterium]